MTTVLFVVVFVCFFQAEDGIRDTSVIGVQTCALPICHGAHRMMGCVECHDKSAKGVKVAHSQTAEDILLPTIQSCQECHRPSGSARNACVECHRYHDRKQDRDPNGTMTLGDVVRKNR